MIKLSKIILEIKIHGNIPPETVIELFNNIFAKIGDLWDDTIQIQNRIVNMDEELSKIAEKYGISDITDGLWEDEERIVMNLDKNLLNKFYKDLLQFKQKHNL